MIKDLFSLREQEIFKTLKELKNCYFVIIGGYAVNAYTLPRFSVDCDIVIKDESELKKIEKALLKDNYTLKTPGEDSQYSGSFFRYEKRLENNFFVSIDVLAKIISDRMTAVSFSAEWIFQNSKMRALAGKTINEELNLRIINIDALIAMKVISCRATDIRDIFMMIPNAKSKEWIKAEISKRYDINERLSKIIEKVNSKQFKDGLSGIYGKLDQKTFERHIKAVSSFQKFTTN